MYAFTAEMFRCFLGLEVCGMCAGFLDDTLQDLRVLQHRAWTEHVVIEWLVIMVSHEQRLFQDLENCILVNISIRVMNKYAWFCITVCINMEVVSSTCDTSSYEFTIVLEVHGKDSRAVFHITDLSYTILHINTLFRIQKQINGSCVSNRHIVEIQSVTSSFVDEHLDERFTGNALVVCACVADGSTKYKSVLFEQIHRMHNFVVYTVSTTHVVYVRLTLYA